MEVKKSPKANLENKKLLFREVGLIVALGLVLCAFEWSSTEKAETIIQETASVEIEVENVPVTTESTPPPPAAPKTPVLSDDIDIVDDNIEVDTDLFISLEDDADMGVPIMDYVAEVYEETIEEEPIPIMVVEEKPLFNGEDARTAFPIWVGKNLVYPDVARENGITGRVYISFTVMPDGTLKNIKVIRGLDPACDKEAIRVVSSSPKWTPGRQRDRAVPVNYQFPVHFQLRN